MTTHHRAAGPHLQQPHPRAPLVFAALVLSLCVAVQTKTPPAAFAEQLQQTQQKTAQPKISVDFKAIPLRDLVSLFSSWTGRNFILLDPSLQGLTLTVYAPKPVTLAEATDLFITALRLQGLEVERRGEFWVILPNTP
jgi:type II secretory pathway component GspD/PulD (secretin)